MPKWSNRKGSSAESKERKVQNNNNNNILWDKKRFYTYKVKTETSKEVIKKEQQHFEIKNQIKNEKISIGMENKVELSQKTEW